MAGPGSSVQDSVSDLWQMLVAYARQETVGPLKALGHQLKWGLPGALCVALGVFLVAMASLRVLQVYSPLPLLSDHNWLYYLAPVLVVVVSLAILSLRMRAGLARAQRPAAESAP